MAASSALPVLPSPPSSVSCFPSSLSSLFLSCIQTRKNKKERYSPNPRTPSKNEGNHCRHTATCCTCTSTADAFAEKDLQDPSPNTISITQTTSIRIVESDSSSDYDSRTSSLDSDSNSVSDYGCGCGENAEHEHEYKRTGEDNIKLPNRPLPPLPTYSPVQRTPSRKHTEIKTSLIEQTIPEEDEDEYLELQSKAQSQDSKHLNRTTSRCKSMIELFNLSTTPFSSSRPRSSSFSSSSSSAGTTTPGLSLSFSNLHFRFPLPPAWGQQQHRSDEGSQGQTQAQKSEKKRPMSLSALSSITPSASTITSLSTSSPERKSKKQEGRLRSQSLQKPLTTPEIPPSTWTTTAATTTSTATATTKKERRMGKILFPPLALLSRSGTGGNNSRDSTGSVSGKSLFS